MIDERLIQRQSFAFRGLAGFASWESRLCSLFDVSPAPGADVSAFSADLQTWQLSSAMVSRATSSMAQQLQRSSERIERHPVDYVVLYLCEGGRLRVEHGKGVSELGVGDILFSDYRQPSTSSATDFGNISLTLDRRCAPAIFRDGSLHGRVLRKEKATTRILAAYTYAICEQLDGMSLSSAEAALRCVVELAAAVWSKEVHRADSGVESDRLLYDAMMLVRDELESPALSAEHIASRLDMSRTQLFDLFKPQGGVRNAILNLRLERAFRALLFEPDRKGAISAVAFRYAFKSEAHFSRAFSRRFGCTPSRVLATQIRNEEALVYDTRMLARHGELSPSSLNDWLRILAADKCM